MTADTSYVARPRASVWEPLSQEHDRARERLETLLASFAQRGSARVLSIVGPYGSGKSELMAWGFRHAWKDLGLPAIFVNLEALLEALPESLSPKELVDEIGTFVACQLNQIAAHLEEKHRPENVHLATDIRRGESFLEYARDLFGTADLDPEMVRACLAQGRAVLFLDEIEQKYAELTKRVSADDRAPFREVFQSIEQGLTDYYLVGSFGLTSAYESVSDADTRRQETVRLPIPRPRRLTLPPEAEPYRNFLWWASRGRPGWARKLAFEWSRQIPQLSALDEIGRLEPRTIDSLPIVDVNAHPKLLSDSRAGTLFTAMLKVLKPIALRELPGFQEPGNLDTLLDEHWFVVAGEDDPVTVSAFCDHLLYDLREFAARARLSVRKLDLLSSYLRLIVQAMADADDTLVLGAWRGNSHTAVRAIIVPLLQMLRDLVLEFEGDTEEVGEVLSLIDEIFAQGKVLGDRIESMATLEDCFEKTIDQLTLIARPRDVRNVALSPFAIDNLFPRMVGRPLLLISPNARGSIREQAAGVEADVDARGWFLNTALQHDNITVRVFFVPGKQGLRRLQESLLDRSERSAYLAAEQVHVIIPLADDLTNSDLNREHNSDDLRVLQQLAKVQVQRLDERRMQDFLVSLWDNLRLMGRASGNADLQTLIDELHNDPALSKTQRRQVDYFRTRLRQRLNQLGPSAASAYRAARNKLFDAQDGRLLDRLGSALNAVKATRTVELVAAAFGVAQDEERSIRVLFELRNLEKLTDLLASPNGYKEFLSQSTAKGSGKGRSGKLLSDIIEYLHANDYFVDLLDVACKLGFSLGDDWMQMSERTEDAAILTLFGRLDEPRATFLRGVVFQAFLTKKQDVLREQIGKQAQECMQIERLLDQLLSEIDRFNTQLGRPLLSRLRIEQHRDELKKLRDLLENSSTARPAIQYILYRFAKAATTQLDERRHRWKGERGLGEWQKAFRPVVNALGQIEELARDTERLYEQNRALKIQFLGDSPQLAARLQQPMLQMIDELFSRIDQTYEIDSNVPSLDTNDMDTTYFLTRADLEERQQEVRAIDQLAEQLGTLHKRIQGLLEQMQVPS